MSGKLVRGLGRSPMGPLIPRTQLALWLDVTLLVSICLLESVTFTGLSIHEWLALLIVGFVLLHLLLSWTWIAASSRRLMATGASRTRVNFLVNACLFASAVTVILSGLMISEVALPAFGIKSAVDGKWKHLHNRTSTYLLILTSLHLAINWGWLLAVAKRCLSVRR